MKRIYVRYEEWEDYQAGMYGPPNAKPSWRHVAWATSLLADPRDLLSAMLDVSELWKVSATVNLSNRSRNRQAWLGQAACCLEVGATEAETKLAWHSLQIEQQDAANAVADKCIAIWECGHNAKANHAEEIIAD
jgi:hypothetical protein